jgi:hypothetical protein
MTPPQPASTGQSEGGGPSGCPRSRARHSRGTPLSACRTRDLCDKLGTDKATQWSPSCPAACLLSRVFLLRRPWSPAMVQPV